MKVGVESCKSLPLIEKPHSAASVNNYILDKTDIYQRVKINDSFLSINQCRSVLA